MKRGDVVSVAVPGAYGKPCPALIVQSMLFSDHPSVTICLFTSHITQTPLFRYGVEPYAANGLSAASQVQIDKIMTVPRDKIGVVIGHLSERQMSEVTKLLALWIGIAE